MNNKFGPDIIMYPNSIELLFMRNVPHILEIILFSLDYESYHACFKVSKAWKELLTSDNFQRKGKYVFGEDVSEDETKLWNASRDGVIEEVRRLLSYGILNVNCVRLGNRATPLCAAAIYGHKEVVKILLEQGANYNKESFTYDVITKIFQLVYSLCQDMQSQLQSIFT